MYNEQSIQLLKERIGWQQPVQPSNITITPENYLSNSGRFFNGFNPIVTVENVYSAIQNPDVTNDTLTVRLEDLKREGVMDVLNYVFDLNVRATAAVTNFVTSVNYANDYNDMISSKAFYFDEAIGYSVAIKTLELLLNTSRSNYNTVSNQEKSDMFDMLNGAFDMTGTRRSKGLYAKYHEVIGKLINVLFPVTYPDGSEVITDGNTVKVVIKEKPVLRGRQGLW